MNRFWLGVGLGSTVTALFLAQAPPLAVPSPAGAPPPSPSQPVELEAQVGKNVYPVRINQPITIVTPKGERVPLLVRRRDVLHFTSGPVSFSYPRQMQVSSETGDGYVTVTAESVGSTVALVQAYTAATTPDAVRRQLSTSFKREFAARGGKLSGSKPSQRKIAGGTRQGERLEWVLAGQRLRSEIYAFNKGEVVLAVVLQRTADEEKQASRYFAIIADSLK